MATTPKVLTYEEWLEMPEVQDGIEEVVNGEVRIMPPNKLIHAYTIEDSAEILRSQLDRKKVWVACQGDHRRDRWVYPLCSRTRR